MSRDRWLELRLAVIAFVLAGPQQPADFESSGENAIHKIFDTIPGVSCRMSGSSTSANN
ncbi:hypothetical protein SynA1560_00353 [Synechococcus sp. A15-60]|nr:hypothetical protein SynA1560_00353 [Synechococcus sp. A15-60]